MGADQPDTIMEEPGLLGVEHRVDRDAHRAKGDDLEDLGPGADVGAELNPGAQRWKLV
jgi:hypothetical protein